MIHLLLSLTLTATPTTPPWVADLIKAVPAPCATEKAVLPAPTGEPTKTPGKTSSPAVIDYNPYPNPDLRALIKESEQLSRRIIPLFERHRYEQAYRESELYCDAHGGTMTDSSAVIVPTMLLTGRYGEAESQMAAYVRDPGHAFESNYLLLSLASSLRGHVAAGQGAYVADSLRRAVQEQGETVPPAWLPRRASTPKDVVLASLLALGYRSPTPFSTDYLEWALRLDPRSEFAATRLIRDYGWVGQHAEVARVARSMVARLPSGKERDGFAETLRFVEGKPNEPLRVPRSGTAAGP